MLYAGGAFADVGANENMFPSAVAAESQPTTHTYKATIVYVKAVHL